MSLKEQKLIERMMCSGLADFEDLAKSLKNTENFSIDLILKGYQGYCSNQINGALREKEFPQKSTYELMIEISEHINIALRKECKRYNHATVWRQDWPCTGNYEDDIKVLEWFEQNAGNVLLFPCFVIFP